MSEGWTVVTDVYPVFDGEIRLNGVSLRVEDVAAVIGVRNDRIIGVPNPYCVGVLLQSP